MQFRGQIVIGTVSCGVWQKYWLQATNQEEKTWKLFFHHIENNNNKFINSIDIFWNCQNKILFRAIALLETYKWVVNRINGQFHEVIISVARYWNNFELFVFFRMFPLFDCLTPNLSPCEATENWSRRDVISLTNAYKHFMLRR